MKTLKQSHKRKVHSVQIMSNDQSGDRLARIEVHVILN